VVRIVSTGFENQLLILLAEVFEFVDTFHVSALAGGCGRGQGARQRPLTIFTSLMPNQKEGAHSDLPHRIGD
jgi:hypothetical protein